VKSYEGAGEKIETSSTSQRIAGLCKPFELKAYDHMGLNPLAAYAVNILATNGVPTTLENITVALFRLFPTKFSLPGFGEYPDSARVTRVLLHLTPKYVNWLIGNPTRGYALNDAGRIAALEATRELKSPNVLGSAMSSPKMLKRKAVKPPRFTYEKERSRLLRSSAFQKYLEKRFHEIKVWEVYDLLGAAPYTPTPQLRNRMLELLQLADDVQDREVIEFVKLVLQHFSDVFTDKSGDAKRRSEGIKGGKV
jgi:hypothetical protein